MDVVQMEEQKQEVQTMMDVFMLIAPDTSLDVAQIMLQLLEVQMERVVPVTVHSRCMAAVLIKCQKLKGIIWKVVPVNV